MKKGMSLPKEPVRSKSKIIRLSPEEWRVVEDLAKKYADGNMSYWMRYASMHFQPIPEGKKK